MQANLRNFTPVLDSVIEKVGIIPATVYGVIMRYARNGDGVCYASQATLGKKLGLSVKTIYTHEKILEAAGLIIRMESSGATIVWRLAIPQEAVLSFENEQAQDTQEELGDLSQGSVNFTEGSVNFTEGGRKILPRGSVNFTDKDTVTKKQLKEYPPEKEKAIPGKNLFFIAKALSEVCGISFEINKKQIMAEAKALAGDGRVTPELILSTYGRGGAWYKKDWRGKKGQRPSLYEIRATLFTFDESEDNVIHGGIYDRPVKEAGGLFNRTIKE